MQFAISSFDGSCVGSSDDRPLEGRLSTAYGLGMALVSFRIEEADAAEARLWAERLGITRAELFRAALLGHLIQLRAEADLTAWTDKPLSPGESSLRSAAEWGPAEDWSDWSAPEG
jgi:hypothetical protein